MPRPQLCADSSSSSSGSENSNIRLMRILKPLRVVKLFKAIKLIGMLKEELAIVLGLTLVKVMVLFGYLASSVHFCACGYWRMKLESNTEEEIADFLGTRRANSEVPPRTRGVAGRAYATCFCTAICSTDARAPRFAGHRRQVCAYPSRPSADGLVF